MGFDSLAFYLFIAKYPSLSLETYLDYLLKLTVSKELSTGLAYKELTIEVLTALS